MTREEAKKKLEFIKAFSEGRTIQIKRGDGSWVDLEEIKGNLFNVEITHWYTEGYANLGIKGEHHWCLYVLISNEHPLFEKATHNNDDYDTELGNEIYPKFHGGCTYYSKQLTYVKIGCDYQHLGDDCYWECEELPADIEQDAKELFDWFNASSREKKQ